MRVSRKLSFRLAAPIVVVTVVVWGVLYFFVVNTIDGFVRDRAQEEFRSISREVLNTCNSAFEDVVQARPLKEPGEARIRKALALGELEDLFKGFQLDAIVSRTNGSGNVMLIQTPNCTDVDARAISSRKRHALTTVQSQGVRFFAYGFDFHPWHWRIVLLRRTAAYDGLTRQIRQLYWTTGFLLICMALGLVLIGNRLVRSPVENIIAKVRRGEPPAYEGIEELEFLSHSFAGMMKTLAEREARVRESEARYRTIFETTGTAMAIYEADTTISLVNNKFGEYTGYSKEETEGNKSWTEIVASEDLRRMKGTEELRRSDPGAGPRQHDFTMVDKFGNRKHMLLTADVIPGTEQTLASLIDITDRKKEELQRRLEQETRAATELRKKNRELEEEMAKRRKVEEFLRASEERFRAVFETAQDAVIIKDTQLKYTHVNPAGLRLLDESLPEIIGRDDASLSDDGFLGAHGRRLEDRVLKGETLETEHSLSWKGVPVCLNVIRFPLRDSSGTVFGICSITRDVTDRKPMRNQNRAHSSLDYPSPVIQKTIEQLNQAAHSNSTVLLLGETGSGKDYWAQYLHENSHRAGGPFFTINCAALSPTLIESELFGHERGAFTGAQSRKRGLLELAEGGTLLLNEIAEMPVSLQAKLLTFLDTGKFNRVGGQRSVSPDSRIIAATNRNLQQEMERGAFRPDLFYRLSVITITVPPLRERIEDLPPLVRHVLLPLCRRMGISGVPPMDTSALEPLRAYHWPGNVRELKNALERALIRWDGKRITAKDLEIPQTNACREENEAGEAIGMLHSFGGSLSEILGETKRRLIADALDRGGSMKEASALLGVSYESLRYQMRSLGL